MANYANLLATIAANIYTNNNNEVTAAMVKAAVDGIVSTLTAGGYLCAGIAHPADAAVTPDANCFWFATEAGTYTNKNGYVLDGTEVVIIKYNGTWSKEDTGIKLVSVSQNTLTGHTDISVGGVTTPVASVEEIVKNTDIFVDVDLNTWTVAPNYNVNVSGGNNVVIAPLAGYYSYYKVLDRDTKISANAIKNAYYAIAYGEDASSFTPPSGSNTTYILVDSATRVRKSENNLPTDQNPITLHAGAIVVVSIMNQGEESSPRLIREETKSKSQETDFVSIEYIDANTYDINLGKYQVQLRYNKSTSNNADLWNLLALRCGNTQITNGDIIGPIKEVGEDDFMGGVHGDEKTTAIVINCDGFLWEKAGKSVCKRLTIDMSSEIYRVSTKAHIFNRYVSIEITPGRIHISNNFIAVDSAIIEAADNGGLIDCPQELVTSVVMPNYLATSAPTTQPNNANRCNVWGRINWVGGSITARNISGKELDTFQGFDYVYASGGVIIRNKIYLATIEGTTKTFSAGDYILGEFEYILD